MGGKFLIWFKNFGRGADKNWNLTIGETTPISFFNMIQNYNLCQEIDKIKKKTKERMKNEKRTNYERIYDEN